MTNDINVYTVFPYIHTYDWGPGTKISSIEPPVVIYHPETSPKVRPHTHSVPRCTARESLCQCIPVEQRATQPMCERKRD